MDSQELAVGVTGSLSRQGLLCELYPMIIDPGIPKGWIHSLLISHLVILGERAGYASIADAGVYDRTTKILTESSHDRRPDAIWIDRTTNNIRLIVEVESSDIVGKAKNIARFSEHIATSQQGTRLSLSVIIWWGSGKEGSWKQAKKILSNGFTEKGYEYWAPQEPILVLHLTFVENGSVFSYGEGRVVDFLKGGISKSKVTDDLQSRFNYH